MVSTIMPGHALGDKLAGKARLARVPYSQLDGFAADNLDEAWTVFLASCRAIDERTPALREGTQAGQNLKTTCAAALALGPVESADEGRRHFQALFDPYVIEPIAGQNPYDQGFVTAYYEPVVEGSLEPGNDFSEPLLARPDDLVTLAPGERVAAVPQEFTSARRATDGPLEPYPDRAAIENGNLGDLGRPIVWLRDAIEVFMLQVQGSGRVRLPDGRLLRLTYAGRNGRPYTSIGRILVDEGHIAADRMSLDALKSWVRDNGQRPGEAGRTLLQRNQSYVFFRIDPSLDPARGPVGAAGIPLTTLRSIAVDRTLFAYGLPFWIETDIPWNSAETTSFHRLMIAQDTGTAIVGAARADIFMGTGASAGERAGVVRHRARMFVLLPRHSAVMPSEPAMKPPPKLSPKSLPMPLPQREPERGDP